METSRKKFELLCATLLVESERYKQKHDEIKNNKKTALEKLDNNYKPQTPLYEQKKKAIEDQCDFEIRKLKEDFSAVVSQGIEEIRCLEFERVQVINETKLAKLKALEDIPVTREELIAISERYQLENDYWCARALNNIAEKNAIDNFGTFIEPDYTTKTNILNQLADQAKEIIDFYDGDNQKDTVKRQRTKHVLLSKTVLDRAKSYWNGENIGLNDSDAVLKAYKNVCSKSTDIEKGFAIGNALQNSKGEKRNELLTLFAEDGKISDFAISVSGFATEIKSFKCGKADAYKKAKNIVSKIKDINDNSEVKNIISKNPNNEFLKSLIESKRKTVYEVREFVATT